MDDAEIEAIQRFLGAMKRVLVECLGEDANSVSADAKDLLRYAEMKSRYGLDSRAS